MNPTTDEENATMRVRLENATVAAIAGWGVAVIFIAILIVTARDLGRVERQRDGLEKDCAALRAEYFGGGK